MTSLSRRPSADDRLAHLDRWGGFARDAAAHAADWAVEPTAQFRQRAEASALWPWPAEGLTRCKALSLVARTWCQAGPDERRAVATSLNDLAERVLEAVAEARPTPTAAPARLPYVED